MYFMNIKTEFKCFIWICNGFLVFSHDLCRYNILIVEKICFKKLLFTTQLEANWFYLNI